VGAVLAGTYADGLGGIPKVPTRGLLQEEVLRICAATRLTVFMIIYDVDEAILRADEIVLMINGPQARIAEVVVNTLPRSRTRHDLHKHPHYYPIRNHLIESLADRSRSFVQGIAALLGQMQRSKA
jgi:nitrate/nitrite transport system ATP-binding protein